MTFHAIVATSNNKGIGLNNQLPWKLRSDLLRFKKLTTGNGNNCIIMGKNTWESTNFLNNRHNYILSSSLNIDTTRNNYEIKSFKDLQTLLNYLKTKNYDKQWVIGGAKIYQTFFNHNLIDRIYLTLIDKNIECDTYFPAISQIYLKKEMSISNEFYNGENYIYYITYQKIKKNQELIYKNIHPCIVKDIHFDDAPNAYITICYDNKEIQTIASNLKLTTKKVII
jgi:dihydrofolate reductase